MAWCSIDGYYGMPVVLYRKFLMLKRGLHCNLSYAFFNWSMLILKKLWLMIDWSHLAAVESILPFIVYWSQVTAEPLHWGDVIMGTIASQITSLTIVCSTAYSGTDQRKHQSSASLAFVRGIHRSPVNSPYKWTVTRKMFPFDDVIMFWTLDKPVHEWW